MRELDKMYGPASTIDRALSVQMLVNSLPDFLIARLQDFEQGQKTIFRKLNLIPVIIANALKLLAYLVLLVGAGLLIQRVGLLGRIPIMNHEYVLTFFRYVGPLLYAVPIVFVVLIWASRYAISRSYIKVQKND